jgi:hypothetical protein
METKIHYLVNNSTHVVPILSQMNPFHTFLHYYPNIYSNIILPSTPRSSA